MNEQRRLMPVVLYDANRNEYSTLKHNLPAEEAKSYVDKWNPQLVSGCSMIALDQPRIHRSPDAGNCQACQKTVTRSAHLSPQPKHVRRKKS